MDKEHNNYFFIICLALLAASLIPYGGFVFFPYTPFFVLGFALYKRFVEEITKWQFVALIAAAMLMIANAHDSSYLIASALPVLLVHLAPTIRHQPLEYLGKISYSLYLIHVPVGGKLVNLSMRFFTHEWQRILIAFIIFGVCILSAHFFFRFIEKPALQWSRRIRYRDN